MVKNHQHGAIGHNKHGSRGMMPLNHHGDEPDNKRLKVSSASQSNDKPHVTALDADAVATLLDDDGVSCSATVQHIITGGQFSLAIEEGDGESTLSHLHRLMLPLLNHTLTDLDLSGNQLATEDCATLAQQLAASSCALRVLNMARVGVGPECGQLLANALHTNLSLTHVNLARNGLGALGGSAIGAALCSQSSCVRSLDLSLNYIGPDGGSSIARALHTNKSLTQLTMLRCGIGPGGGKPLGEALETNTTLVRLDLTQNDLGVEGGAAMGRALEQNTTLKTLNMRFNRIGFGLERATGFAKALEVNTSLTWLDMSQNELGAIGGGAFGASLAHNRSLTWLDLQRNELGTQGGADVGKGLAANSTLVALNVSSNDVGHDGAVEFGRALRVHPSLKVLNLAKNGLGSTGAQALSDGLSLQGPLESLDLEGNELGPLGGQALAAAIGQHATLTHLNISLNGLEEESGEAFAMAVQSSPSMRCLKMRANGLGASDGAALGAAIAAHKTLAEVDLSDNNLTSLPIEAQLQLSERATPLEFDLSNNPLSSPPLGRRATADALREYLSALRLESTAITRLRLMVCGFGGVGKTTFCTAATRPDTDLSRFHGSLLPLDEWDTKAIAQWARGLGKAWSEAAATAFGDSGVVGNDLRNLVIRGSEQEAAQILREGGTGGVEATQPSPKLREIVGAALSEQQLAQLAIAIGSLLFKGYFSTVGAVKVEGTLRLPARADGAKDRVCSLVDFAGQMEYLVSHQLLLASMHTICMVIQPLSSFSQPEHRHHGSWRYWLRFLRALGDRRGDSLLLAVSQIDKLNEADAAEAAERAVMGEFGALRDEIGGGLGQTPLRLEYRAAMVSDTMTEVRRRLSEAADAVARDWWVPASYERLAEVVRALGQSRREARQLPIIPRSALQAALAEQADEGLRLMSSDAQLLQRGVEYLEAVGDVLVDDRIDCVLLDPVGWFAAFMAHFIRDDGNRPAEVVRGVVSLDAIVAALSHEYTQPEEQVPEVMALVCKLELCLRYPDPSGTAAPAYLFPCLLPEASQEDLAEQWPFAPGSTATSAPPVVRGHRLRATSGFLPPGLFPTLVARLMRLKDECVDPLRLWSNAAVVCFHDARVLFRLDLDQATLDVVVAAPADGAHFVGAAKGQAPILTWMMHLVKGFLRRAYERIVFDEFWLCPSPECHGVTQGGATAEGRGVFTGSLFALNPGPRKARKIAEHFCEHEGCWHQLGQGHKLEPMQLCDGEGQVCRSCQRVADFSLRAGGQFGWANQEERQQLLRGFCVAQPQLNVGGRC